MQDFSFATAICTTHGALRPGNLKLLDAGHQFTWLTLENYNAAGMYYIVSVGELPGSSGSKLFFLYPGGRVPIGNPGGTDGLAVYVSPAHLAQENSSSDADDLQVRFIASRDVGAYSPQFQTGQCVLRTRLTKQDIAAGSTVVICDSDDFSAVAYSLPLSLRIKLAGGQLTWGTDYPCELILREFDDHATPLLHHETFVFPGDGSCSIFLPLANQIYKEASDSYRWRLEAHTPAGAQTKTVAAIVEALIGHIPMDWQYCLAGHASGTLQDVAYLSFAARWKDHGDDSVRDFLYNNTATPTMRNQHSNQIPTTFGGPARITVTNRDQAPGASGNATAPWGPFSTFACAWTTGAPDGAQQMSVCIRHG